MIALAKNTSKTTLTQDRVRVANSFVDPGTQRAKRFNYDNWCSGNYYFDYPNVRPNPPTALNVPIANLDYIADLCLYGGRTDYNQPNVFFTRGEKQILDYEGNYATANVATILAYVQRFKARMGSAANIGMFAFQWSAVAVPILSWASALSKAEKLLLDQYDIAWASVISLMNFTCPSFYIISHATLGRDVTAIVNMVGRCLHKWPGLPCHPFIWTRYNDGGANALLSDADAKYQMSRLLDAGAKPLIWGAYVDTIAVYDYALGYASLPT